MRVRGVVFVVAAVVGAGMLPASASAQTEGSASGSVGEVSVTLHGAAVTAAPIAPCDADGPATGESSGTDRAPVATYGRGSSVCGRTEQNVASAKITARRFESEALREFGGPVIRIREYTNECVTTENGAGANMTVSGVSGINVPPEIPPNYTVRIPGPQQGDPPLADVVLNELVTPTPPDGSLTAHTMRITLFPEGGGDASGDIIAGTVTCDPF